MVGALLQNRLALALHDEAIATSAYLPVEYRASFVDNFSQAARSGFQVGAGQSGASLQLPAEIQGIAHSVFTHAFVDAMHPTLALPTAFLVIAALGATFLHAHGVAAVAPEEEVTAAA